MRWMVSFGFRVAPEQQAEVAALIPQEQAHIKELTAQGVVEALYISADRSHVWLVMQGDSEAEVAQSLETFPLYPYMLSELTPLL